MSSIFSKIKAWHKIILKCAYGRLKYENINE